MLITWQAETDPQRLPRLAVRARGVAQQCRLGASAPDSLLFSTCQQRCDLRVALARATSPHSAAPGHSPMTTATLLAEVTAVRAGGGGGRG